MFLVLATASLLAAAPGGPRGPSLAWAQSAFEQGDFEAAVDGFLELAQDSKADPAVRQQAEYRLALSLERAGYPFAALVYFAPLVRVGPSHPFHAKGVEALLRLQASLDDDYLVPSILNNGYDANADAWTALPPDALARINYLIGRTSFRKDALDEARLFLESVPSSSVFRARARYMIAAALADPRFPAADPVERRKNATQAVATFEEVLSLDGGSLEPEETRNLATLALGRVSYNLGQFAEAAHWYEQVPRFSPHWPEALLEAGYARFQNDDPGGALGALQALHAPQLSHSFQPESWILTATVYAFACLYAEALGALAEFDRLYLPVAEALRRILEVPDRPLEGYYRLVAGPEDEGLPPLVKRWVQSSRRMAGLTAMLGEIDAESSRLGKRRPRGAADELRSVLGDNRRTLEAVAGTLARARLLEARATLKALVGQAEVLRFEVAKGEKEMIEAGFDQPGALLSQTLLRPALPADHWSYWPFEGEFWRDEIGSYQYTFKQGCPKAR